MKRHIFTVSILLVAAQLFGQESRFWVGGSGKWADVNHWATVSGGEPGATVPESGTSVVFDENSFSGDKNTVTLGNEVSVGSLTASNAAFVVSGKKDLIVKGSISVDANVDFGKLRGALVFDGKGSHTVSLPVELETDVIFNNGTWTLLDGLNTTGTVTINGGVLNSNNNKISCKDFVTNSKNVVKVDFGTSAIDIENRWDVVLNNDNSEIDASNAALTMIGGFDGNFRSVGNAKYNNIINQGNSDGSKDPAFDAWLGQNATCPTGEGQSGQNGQGGTADGEINYSFASPLGYNYDIILYVPDEVGNFIKTTYQSNIDGTKTTGKIEGLKSGFHKVTYVKTGTTPSYPPIKNVPVGPDPITPSVVVKEPALCYGGDIQELVVRVTGGTGDYKYEWTKYPFGNFGTDSIAYNIPDQSNMQVEITDDNGCKTRGGFDYFSDDDESNDYKNQPTQVISSPVASDACGTQPTGEIKISAEGGTKIFNYFAVSDENGLNGKDVTPTTEFTIDGLTTGWYNIIVRDTNGCLAASNTAFVGSTPSPVVSVTTPIDVCEGRTNIPLEATASNYASVQWTTTNGTPSNLSNSDKVQASYTPTSADVSRGYVDFTFYVSALTGCSDESESVKMNIYKKPTPTINTADNQEVCGNVYSGGLSATAKILGDEIKWSIEGPGECRINDDMTVTVEIPESQDIAEYTITATEISQYAEGCEGTAQIKMKFRALPKVEVSALETSPICGSDKIHLTAKTSISSVTWTGGTGFSSTTAKSTIYDPINDQGSEVTLVATVTGEGACSDKNATDFKKYTIKQVPDLKAIVAPEVCDTVTPVELSGRIGGVLSITKLSGEGTVESIGETATSVILRVSTAGESPYSIAITETKDGCSDSDTVSVKFNRKPRVELELEEDAFCFADGEEGHPVKVKELVNCSVVSWSVSSGSGNFSPTEGKEVKFKPDLPVFEDSHTYIITATGTPTPGISVCTAPYFDKMTMVVNRKPNPSINDDAPYCGVAVSEELISVSVSASGVLSSSTKKWDCTEKPAGSTFTFSDETSANTDFIVSQAGSYKLTFTETLGNCSKTVDRTIYVNGVVIADAGDDMEVCPTPGDVAVVGQKAENGSIMWTGPNGWSATTLSATYPITAADIAANGVTLTLTVTRTGDCAATASDTKKITFREVETPSISGNLSACYKSEEEYSTKENMKDYEWDVEDGTIIEGDGTYKIKVKWESDGDHDIKVTYKDENECVTPQGSITVTVNSLPNVAIAGAIDACAGQDKELNAAPSGATPFKSHSWTGTNVDQLLKGNTTVPNPTFNASVAGDYSLTYTVVDANSCEYSKPIVIKVINGPSLEARDTVMCYDTDTLKIRSYTADNYSGLTWNKIFGSGKLITTDPTAPLYVPDQADLDNGYFQIEVIAGSGGVCDAKKDTMTVTVLPEMIAAVGGESPYLISASTDIKVTISMWHEHFAYAAFYLVAPDGTEVKLYSHIEDVGTAKTKLKNKDMVNLTFSTKESKKLNLESLTPPFTGEYAISGDWSAIYGKDPAEGGWSVAVKSTFGTAVGTLKRAYIEFTDINVNTGDYETIRFDSKEIAKHIPFGRTTRYISPIGLMVKCFGSDAPEDMAHAIVFADGGSKSFTTYKWSTNGIFDEADIFDVKNTNRKDLAAGTFYVRVYDTYGCTADASVDVYSPDKIQISLVEKDTVDCFGKNTGVLEATAALGVGTMTYSWRDVQTGDTQDGNRIENLVAGKYNFHVEDANHCKVDSVFEITQPATAVEITGINVKPSTCDASDGEVTFTVAGGTPGDGPLYTIAECGDPSAIIDNDLLKATNLMGGKIAFKIKDKNGCAVDSAVKTMPTAMELEFDSVPITCYDDFGQLAVKVKGGKYPFKFAWDNGATDSVITVKSGTYTVEVTDDNGCTASENVKLGQPLEITTTVKYDQLCSGDLFATVIVSAQGGNPENNSYSYTWYDLDDDTQLVSDSIFDNAVPGHTYYVSVKDKDCEVLDTIVIPNPTPLAINMGTVNASDCAVNNGSAEVETVTGGLAPYKYNWYAMFDENKTSVGNAIKATDLGVDFYIVEVTDSLGCQVYDTVEINGGGNIDFDLAFAGVTCTTIENGRAQVFNVTSNGVPVNDAQIAWNGDNSQLFTQLDTVKTLHFGWNKFMVTTADGCRAGRVNIDASQALRADITSTPIVREGNCNGAFEIAISGGSGEYTYSVKDAAGKELNTNYDAQEKMITSVDDLCAGTYYLHVDIEGGSDCPVDESFEIESRKLHYALASQNGVVHVNCKGDSTGVITGQAVGGYYNDEYVYEWRSSLWGEDSVRTTATINGLKTGSYNLKVLQYHESGLVKDTLVYDTLIVVNEPTNKFVVLADSIKVVGTPCYDEIGSISIGVNAEAFHGTPKTYTFSFDEWTSDVVTTTPLLTDLKSGDYRMKVEDENGCSFVDTITVEDLSNFTIDFQTKEPDCHGMNDGFIRLDVKGGNGNLHYSWTRNNVAIDDTTALLVGLDSAAYFVTVIDDSLCKRTKLIELGQPRELLTNVKFDKPIICYGDTEADFHSEPQGGTAEYTFVWTDAIKGDTLSLNSAMLGVGEGSYAIKVVDAHRCSASDTINIVYPDSLFVEMGSEKSECAGATGYAAVKINGGVAPYVVSWTAKYSTDTIIRTDTLLPGVMVDTLSNVGPDMYYVTVVDALGTGCSIADSVEVLDDGDLRFKPDLTNELYCLTNPNGGAMISKVMNGKTFELYTDAKIIWNAGNDTVNIGDTIKTLHYGKNIVEVISMPDGCRKFGELEFTDDYALRILTIDNIPVRGVETATNGALIAEIGGGYPKYTVVWENEAGDTLQIDTTAGNTALYGLSVGKYILNVKDQNPETCELTDTIEIKFSPLRDSITVTNVTCNGWSNGKITAQGIGGLNRPYLYEWSSELWGEDSVRTTQTITDLKAGFYVLKLSQLYSTDSVECLYDTIEVTQPVNKLMVEKLLVDSIPSHCYDSIGAIVINQPTGFEKLFGGNAPFTYKFSRDNWSVVKNSANEEKVEVTGLTIGDYNLYVVDSLGCDYNTTITIDDLSEFRIKKVDVEKPICYDDYGTITVTAESKNGGFKYGWTDVEGNKMNDTTNNVTVKSGTYVVKVTDDSLCVKFDTITVKQIKPVLFSVSNTIENSCYNVADGEVKFTKLSGEEGRTFNKFIFLNPDDAKDVKLSVSEKVAVNDSAEFTLKLDADNYNLVSGTYKVRVEDAASCLSEPVDLEIKSKYPQIDISSYVSTADVTGPDCQAYTADGKISNNGWVKINFKQVSGTVSFRFDDRSVTEDQQPTFEKVTSGNHLLTVGYTDKLVCAVTDTIKVNGKNSFAIEEAGFYQNGKNSPAIFTCPDNELSAYVTAKGNFTYSFYAQYIEEPVEEVVVPVDTTTADSNGVAYVSRFRTLRFYADSLNQDSSATETPVVPEVVKKPAYKKLETINGVVYAVFEDSSATNKGWADFMPYGGETYYYVSVSDGKCMDIDSIKATSMKPVNKLNARLGGDESFRSVVYGYEVPEGGLVQFEANTPEFEFGNSQSVFIENYWKWDFAGENEASGLMPEIDFTGNPMVAKAYGDIKVKVTDSVVFTAYDAIYNIDDDLTCYYTDELKVSAISGITPADVFTPNNDGANDVWRIKGLASYENVTIYVFNRWGGRVWQYSGSGADYDANQWDGRNAKNKPLPSGTYYYVIQCSDNVLVGKKVTGPVTIIR